MKNNVLKIVMILSITTLLLTSMLCQTAFAVTSPAFSNWYWTNDTNATAVVVGDVDNDGANDVVIAGYYNDGNGWKSQLHVLNSSTYAIKSVGYWTYGLDSQIMTIAVGDVNGDGLNEVVTGGAFFNGTQWNSLVTVQRCTSASASMTTLYSGNWTQGVGSQVSSVAVGDVNGDGSVEIVVGGSFNDGAGWNSLVNVINCSTNSASMNMLTSATWKTGNGSQVSSVAVGDVNGDGSVEIVVGGSFNDGTRSNSLLHILRCAVDFATLSVLDSTSWYWTGNTYVNSITVANITGSVGLSIIAGGSFNDGSRYNSVVHVLSWTTVSGFVVQQTGYWFWISDTKVTSVTVGNFTGQSTYDIITGGSYYDGSRYVAQFMILNSITLAQRVVTNWFSTSSTQINSAIIGSTPVGTRVFAGGSFFDNNRSVAQLTVWA